MSDTETNGTEPTVWGTATPVPSNARDEHGRFLTGNNGGGRRKGSRNKLTERFLDTIADDFAEHGVDAIAKVRVDDPIAYLNRLSPVPYPRLANFVCDRDHLMHHAKADQKRD